MGNIQHKDLFERIAVTLTKLTGTTFSFVTAISVIIIWALTGPVFGYSDTWQLVINTGTTIITFLMVFLIQRTQNKDSLAIQLKLNELIASVYGSSNRLIDVEDLSEKELEILRKHFSRLAQLYSNEKDIKQSHSIEEAEKRHKNKIKRFKTTKYRKR